MANRSFSRREWLLTIALILLAEACVLNSSYFFRDQTDVINYISFASTVTSLILAVIAIIYGFVQAEGQQKNSVAIGLQVDALKEVQTKVDSAAAGLKGEVHAFQSLSTTIQSVSDSIDQRFTAVEQGLQKLHEKNDGFHATMLAANIQKEQMTTDEPLSVEEIPAGEFPAAVAQLVLRRTNVSLDVIGYILHKAFSSSPLLRTKLSQLLRFVSQLRTEENTLKYDNLTAALQILIAAGFLERVREAEVGYITINAENLAMLEGFARETREDGFANEQLDAIDATPFPRALPARRRPIPPESD